MIEAKIISIDDKVMVEWPPEPEKFDIKNMIFDVQAEVLKRSVIAYDESKTIAEVENVDFVDSENQFENHFTMPLVVFDNDIYSKENRIPKLNQTVFIEPTENNKVKIIKI